MRGLTLDELRRKKYLYKRYVWHGCAGSRASVMLTLKFDRIYAEYIAETKSKESKRDALLSLLAVLKWGKAKIRKRFEL